MKTPICDFIEKYAQNDNLRLHMPGHKGVGSHGELFDITEISGADSLFEADGIIAESEKNAGELFGARTFYSAEGSSLAIRAMVYLCSSYAKANGRRPLILAARNVHKTFVSAVAMLDAEVEWIAKEDSDYLSCKLTGDEVKAHLDTMAEAPVAVYITSPDYLGNMSDVEGIARVCHDRGVLLVVDNAHGAYLKFLKESRHPIDLGADMCCDSAHKTLPALTGAAYLHVSENAPEPLVKRARSALSLFGSTSPSYLILASLDRVNSYIANGYKGKLESMLTAIEAAKSELRKGGYTLAGDEPMKLTISAKPYGYLGTEMAQHLESVGIYPEFSDPDYLVLMPSPENGKEGIDRLLDAMLSLEKKEAILAPQPKNHLPERALTIREAVLADQETISADAAEGRILASVTVACPPAVPILVSGERISSPALTAFRYYGINKISVVK